MNDEVIEVILGTRINKMRAVLSGYHCLSVLNECYPGIQPEKDGVVTGELLLGLSQEQMDMLDSYEGDYYQRQTVLVTDKNNIERSCETYVFKPKYFDLLSNESWNNDKYRKNHMDTFIKKN